MTTSRSGQADEIALRRIFGDLFIDWVISTDGGPDRSPEQLRVLGILEEESRRFAPEAVRLPPHVRLSHLLNIDPVAEATNLNRLHWYSGGIPVELPSPAPEDEVLAALQQWTAENFGGLLLGGGGFGLGWNSQARERLTRALAADPLLPFTPESKAEDGLYQLTSLGGANGLQLALFGPGIVEAALQRASMAAAEVRVSDVLEALPAALAAARDLWSGKTVETVARAGLAGVFLPDEKSSLEAPWGRVRAAREMDNSLLDRSGALTMALPDGTQLVSQDAGDLTIEMLVPWNSEFVQPPQGGEIPKLREATSGEPLRRRVEEVRIAFALAMSASDAPALLPTWAKVEDPLVGVTGFSSTELARLRPRTPTRLTVAQAEEWERWIAILDGLKLGNLGHAPQRLLRAITERSDPVDALVDAVIVWESIFGTHAEITFRVSASLARLLNTTVDERLAFVKKAKGIYEMRSRIVHGSSEISAAKIDQARDDAVRIAVEALRALATERRDLLEIPSSSQRSERIMLE